MSQNQNDITGLLAFVRKHQKYVGDKIVSTYNPYETIDLWRKSYNIDRGTNAVKAFVLRRHYVNWCKEKGYSDKDIAKTKTFNSTMKEILNFKLTKNNVFFYINIRVKYEPSIKGGQGQKKKTKEKDSVGS